MAVAFDAQGTTNASVSNNGTGHQDFTGLTVGSGSDRGVVFQIATFGAPTGVTVTWDFGGTAQGCTQLVSANDPAGGSGGHVELWGLVAPTSGNKTCRVAWTGGPGLIDICVDGVAYTGVDQTGGSTSFPNATSANGSGASPTSVTVTSATGDAAVEVGVNTSTFNAQNQTSVFLDNSPDHISAEGQRAAGAATVNFTATFGGGNWVSAGVSVKASGGGGATVVHSLSALGAGA